MKRTISKVLAAVVVLSMVMGTMFIGEAFAEKALDTVEVELVNESFTGTDGSGAANWMHKDTWGNTFAIWKIKNNALAYYDNNYSATFSTSKELDVTVLPDVYDLNIEYKIKGKKVAGSYSTRMVLSEQPTPLNTSQATNAATVLTLNGDCWGQDKTGFFYTTSGNGIALYDNNAGYDDSKWYTVKTIAHIDGDNNAKFDIAVYNEDGTQKLSEVNDVLPSGGDAGMVKRPKYLSFIRFNTGSELGETYIDDLKVTASYSKYINRINLFSESFDGADGNWLIDWTHKDKWGNTAPRWMIKDNAMAFYGNMHNYQGQFSASHSIDVSALPDEYELHVDYKIKSDAASRLSTSMILANEENLFFTSSQGTNGSTLVTLNDTAENGFTYRTDGNADLKLYKVSDGYTDRAWYTVKTVAYIDGVNKAKFDVAIYNEDGTQKLSEVKGIEKTSWEGTVVEPTYLTFFRNNNNDASGEVFIDDLDVYATTEYVTTASIENVSVQAVTNQDEQGIMRFIFRPTFSDEISAYGAYIVPLSIFTDVDGIESVDSALVSQQGSFESGMTFSTTLTNIPQTKFDTSIVSVPFVTIDGINYFGLNYSDENTVNNKLLK